jgi:hypothetical protein
VRVKCAGGGWWITFGQASTKAGAVVRAAPDAPDGSSDPCGWRGNREYSTRGVTRPTDNPCPKCGGRVELVDSDGW